MNPPATRLRRALAWASAATLVAALTWWAIVFTRVLAADILTPPQALACLGASSGTCELAMALCSSRTVHLFGLKTYSPGLLWAGLVLLSTRLLLTPAAPGPR